MLFDCSALQYWETITYSQSLELINNIKVESQVTFLAFNHVCLSEACVCVYVFVSMFVYVCVYVYVCVCDTYLIWSSLQSSQ